MSTTKTEELALDKSIADSFPASDPPSRTTPVPQRRRNRACPCMKRALTGDELHVYRVIEPRKATEPFSGPGADAGGRWTSPRTPGVYASLTPAAAILEYLVHLEARRRTNSCSHRRRCR